MFKEKLKLLREEHHLSQVELANKIYVSRSAVAKWEQGRGMPSKASLQELCKLFNLTEEELLNEKEQYIYTFDYKKEKIIKTIIISIVIAIPVLLAIITGTIDFIEKKKPDHIDNMKTLPTGGPKYITLKLNEEYEIDWEELGLSDKFENFEVFEEEIISHKNIKHYTANKNVIKVINTGSFFVYGNATKKRWTHVVSQYYGPLVHIYCYDENKITKINTVEDFININNNLEGEYLLNNNLDFSSIDNFQSIGYISEDKEITHPFMGVIINPYKYIISNINIKEQKENQYHSYGLFNATRDAYINGLIVENLNVDMPIKNKSWHTTVGGLVGKLDYTTIVNCSINGIVKGIGYVGGIVGELYYSKMINCVFLGKVINIDGCAGGLAGSYWLNTYSIDVRKNKVVAEIQATSIAGKITGIIYTDYYNDNEATCTLYAPRVYEFGSIDEDSQIIHPSYK